MTQRIAVKLEGLAHGGEAFGRHDNRIIFVPYAVPGEQVWVEIQEQTARWARGRLVDIVVPSPHRVQPPCPYFGICHGCQLQHIAYPLQKELKREVVRDQICRLGHVSDVPILPVIGPPEPQAYRNQARLYPTSEGTLGIRAGSRGEPYPIDSCLLFHPLVAELFDALELELEELESLSLRAGIRSGDQMVVFHMAGLIVPELVVDLPISCVVQTRSDVRVMAGDGHLWEHLMGRPARISALSPFPVNTEIAEKMALVAAEYLDVSPVDTVLDAGSGIGLFSLPLADHANGVIAIEENEWAGMDFLANVGEKRGKNGGERGNIGLVQGEFFDALSDEDLTADVAIVNPPRGGLGAQGCASLARIAPRRLVYVAQDPAMLARDIPELQQAGFHLSHVQPFDLAPLTSHIACVAFWERMARRPL